MPGSYEAHSTFAGSGNRPGLLVEVAIEVYPGQQLEWWPCDIAELDIRSLLVDVVIGRDLLARWTFQYDGPKKQYTLTW
jgi:hypothetical protein